MGWFEERFSPLPSRVQQDCHQCGRPMWFPSCKAGKYLTCGAECSAALREAKRLERQTNCLTCLQAFIPRPAQLRIGGGKYCCIACAEPGRAAGRTPEVAAKRGAEQKRRFASGVWAPPRGEDNPNWKGGKAARKARAALKVDERRAKRRAYLKANPHKAREWRQSRRGIGSLPKGTVGRLMRSQRGLCPVCRADLKNGYHLDHVVPLAKGGKHRSDNVQLLCPTCNIQKSAKDPVEFMQSRGFLL